MKCNLLSQKIYVISMRTMFYVVPLQLGRLSGPNLHGPEPEKSDGDDQYDDKSPEVHNPTLL